MGQPQADWPGIRWNLTAPESYVLNYVGHGFGIEASKLAVKELVSRRALRVEPIESRGGFGFRKQRSALTEGPVKLTPPPALAPVLSLFEGAEKRRLQAGEGSAAGMRPVEGVLMEDFAKAARKQFGRFDNYCERHVVPALVARGLMTTETRMVLGIVPVKRKTWTDTGREAVDELDRWLQAGRERLGGWVSTDPMKALAYTSGAGAAILLVHDAYPEFALLGQQLDERRALAAGGDGGGANSALTLARPGSTSPVSTSAPSGWTSAASRVWTPRSTPSTSESTRGAAGATEEEAGAMGAAVAASDEGRPAEGVRWRWRQAAGLAVAALGLALAAGPAEAALRFQACGPGGFRCARLAVPLDRSGAVPGEVSLLVERDRARRARRPPVVVLAGGPGESATATAAAYHALLGRAARSRDVIVFDQRGTGRSGLLRCRPLERAGRKSLGDAVADCARRLGARSGLYTTRDSVADIEAVRQALGARRIALFGISYGTKVALAYALAYPQRIERLALDSVAEPDGPSALNLQSFEATPRVLSALCRGGGCRGISRDPVRDLEQLVARLAQGPLSGSVISPRGKRRSASLSRRDLFDLLLLGDLDGTLRLAFPAAVRSALRNDAAPILRLQRRALATVKLLERIPPRLLSVATNVATTCEETPLPWTRTAPVADRGRQAAVFATGLPDALFRPFDRLTALDSAYLEICERWPAAPTAPSVASGPAPNVPVLLLEGEDDLRTPVEGARRVAARFPAARVLVVQEAGHVAILADDENSCALRGLQRFFTARRVRRACSRDDFRLDEPSPVVPLALRELRPVRGVRGRSRGQALRALQLTVFDAGREAFRESLANIFSDFVRAGGLRAGSLRYHSLKERIGLKGYSLVPGVSVSGVLRRFDSTRRVHGRLRIAGLATPGGKLRVRGRLLTGQLGGRRVRARLSLDQISGLVAASARQARPQAAARRTRTPQGAVIGVPWAGEPAGR